ncbi:MAG TPA: hypothetical protein VER75_01720 [Thermoleophilaceae bacterium]|nr:hypothetical protein [Thermoleophilaceae bacterium]
MARPIVLVASVVALLALAPAALAQGGAPAPDFIEPCPATYPGDDGATERIARWMARGAAERGLPHELPVMAGIAESGLRNLRGGSYHGFFGMHESLNTGDYRGFPRQPDLQLHWFLDTAGAVRQRRVAEGRPDPAADKSAFGIWIADVERPAPENRSGYQRHLDEARRLVADKCAEPVRDDVEPPRLRARIAARQRALAAGGIAVAVRCPDADCLSGATATVTVGERERTLRAAAIEPPERGYGRLVLRLPRALRRELAQGRSVRALITAFAADAAANLTSRGRPVLLVP